MRYDTYEPHLKVKEKKQVKLTLITLYLSKYIPTLPFQHVNNVNNVQKH